MRKSGFADATLEAATERVVQRALGVGAAERVVIVFDEAHQQLADFLSAAVRAAKSEPIVYCLEELGDRPHGRLPDRIAYAMSDAQASVLLVDFHEGELQMRTEMTAVAAHYRLRHGHMVGVGRSSVIAGFSVDSHRIAEKARALSLRLKPSSVIAVRSAAGTDLAVSLAARCQWVEYGAVVPPGRRVNLPGGELVTSPDAVNGVFVADGTLGDADGALSRSLASSPVTLRIAASRVQAIECVRDRALARELSERLSRVVYLDRVGLVSFGTNIGVTKPVGEIFTDQKVPGVHLSLGETFPARTGATWTSKTWIAFTVTECDADVDKVPVLRSGRYIV